jgi:hypothetical protein
MDSLTVAFGQTIALIPPYIKRRYLIGCYYDLL